jgi:hypothetical protein
LPHLLNLSWNKSLNLDCFIWRFMHFNLGLSYYFILLCLDYIWSRHLNFIFNLYIFRMPCKRLHSLRSYNFWFNFILILRNFLLYVALNNHLIWVFNMKVASLQRLRVWRYSQTLSFLILCLWLFTLLNSYLITDLYFFDLILGC